MDIAKHPRWLSGNIVEIKAQSVEKQRTNQWKRREMWAHRGANYRFSAYPNWETVQERKQSEKQGPKGKPSHLKCLVLSKTKLMREKPLHLNVHSWLFPQLQW